MILDTLLNSEQYAALGAGFKKAFTFLKRPNLADLPAGKQVIDGDKVFAIVSKGSGKKRSEGKLETHQRYIDIQYVISGKDEMGWKPEASCTKPAGPYDVEKDIRFHDDEPYTWFTVTPGAYAIFFPRDAQIGRASCRE